MKRLGAGKTNVKFKRRKVTNFHLVLIGLQSRWFNLLIFALFGESVSTLELCFECTFFTRVRPSTSPIVPEEGLSCLLPSQRPVRRIAYHVTLRRHRLL